MSKKSRRRNKKILGALGALGALTMLGNRKPKQSSVSADSGRGSGLRPTIDDMEFKETVISAPMKKPVIKKRCILFIFSSSEQLLPTYPTKPLPPTKVKKTQPNPTPEPV